MSKDFDWILDDLEVKENPEHDGYELPKCLLSVDVRNNIHLIKILNEDKVNEFFQSIDFWEYFDNEYLEDEIPGIYIATCNINSWQDDTPDSCDWNSELVIVEMTEYKIETKG